MVYLPLNFMMRTVGRLVAALYPICWGWLANDLSKWTYVFPYD